MCRVGKIFQGDLLGTSESCDSPHYLISPSQQLPNPRGHGGPDLQGPGSAGDAGPLGQSETRWLPGTFLTRPEGVDEKREA